MQNLERRLKKLAIAVPAVALGFFLISVLGPVLYLGEYDLIIGLIIVLALLVGSYGIPFLVWWRKAIKLKRKGKLHSRQKPLWYGAVAGLFVFTLPLVLFVLAWLLPGTVFAETIEGAQGGGFLFLVTPYFALPVMYFVYAAAI